MGINLGREVMEGTTINTNKHVIGTCYTVTSNSDGAIHP